jgi:hypothetical protein
MKTKEDTAEVACYLIYSWRTKGGFPRLTKSVFEGFEKLVTWRYLFNLKT